MIIAIWVEHFPGVVEPQLLKLPGEVFFSLIDWLPIIRLNAISSNSATLSLGAQSDRKTSLRSDISNVIIQSVPNSLVFG